MSKSWIPETIAGFRITRSRRERMRRKAERFSKSKRTRTIAALAPALVAGAITVIRMRRGTKVSA